MDNFVALKKKYEDFKKQNLKLDMSRGKPSPEQLDLSMEMLIENNYISEKGIDYRNYGLPEGIAEAKKFFAEVMNLNSDEIIVSGNSSLTLMFEAISCFMLKGISGELPWSKQGKIKWLCPSPGYDRHFSICEYFGIEMINVNMNYDGPDMDFIEKVISSDPQIKGIWCVPKYSNPQGITYSNETVKRFANLKTAAKDFRIFWDNAYCVHDLTENGEDLLNLMKECEKTGNENLPLVFGSTSKITFAGSGIAAVASHGDNLEALKNLKNIQSVGPDKMNQLRHIKFLKNKEFLKKHMMRHREILKPKFDVVLKHLEENFGENKLVQWSTPKGGYFVSVEVPVGCAKKVVQLCKDVGLILTPAGSAFPYKNDPNDSNIRIAPSFPSVNELEKAMELFCVAVKLANLGGKSN